VMNPVINLPSMFTCSIELQVIKKIKK